MNKKALGNSTLQVSPICLGGNVFGWTIDEKRSFKVLDAFVDAGMNFIDTADYYSRWAGKGGESETIIGKWMKLRNNRNKVIIATKVGLDMGEGRSGLSAKYIRRAVEDSLRRLQTDHIDLYQSHRDDPKTPVEETLGTYTELIKEGKVKFIGASNYSPQRLSDSLNASVKNNFARYVSLQPHYNLCERKLFEPELEKICLEHKLGVIPYYSLAAGFLSGKYRSRADLSKSVRGGGVEKYMNTRGFSILDALDEVSRSHNSSQAAVALAWLLSRPVVTAPIASATSAAQVRELAAAAGLRLSTNDLARLDAASS